MYMNMPTFRQTKSIPETVKKKKGKKEAKQQQQKQWSPSQVSDIKKRE